jgi:hypothetical protein
VKVFLKPIAHHECETKFFVERGRGLLPLLQRNDGGEGWGEEAVFIGEGADLPRRRIPGASGFTQRDREFSLAPRERAGVRGKEAKAATKAPGFPMVRPYPDSAHAAGLTFPFPSPCPSLGARGSDFPRRRIPGASGFIQRDREFSLPKGANPRPVKVYRLSYVFRSKSQWKDSLEEFCLTPAHHTRTR